MMHSTPPYKAAKHVFTDDSVLVEITSIVGYYTFCAYTLNLFQIPVPTKKMSLTEED
jgi:alkylhydroperoxidase family enzyme